MPVTFGPNNQYKPGIIMGAAQYGRERVQNDRANTLANLYQELMNQKMSQENARYSQMTPLEVQVKQLDAAKAGVQSRPDMLEAFARGKLGEFQSQEAKGREDIATADAKVDAVKLQQYDQHLSVLDELVNTQGAAAALSFAEQQGWNMGKLAPLIQNPQMLKQTRAKVREALVNTAASEQKMKEKAYAEAAETSKHLAVEELKGKYDVERAEITAGATSQAASVQQRANELKEYQYMINDAKNIETQALKEIEELNADLDIFTITQKVKQKGEKSLTDGERQKLKVHNAHVKYQQERIRLVNEELNMIKRRLRLTTKNLPEKPTFDDSSGKTSSGVGYKRVE